MLILASTDTVCVLSSVFVSLVCVPVGNASSAVGLKICAITAETKKYKSTINKQRKKYDEIVLLAKTKLDAIEVLNSKTFIESYINHDEFLSLNNALRGYNDIKEEIKIVKTLCKML